MSFSLSVCSGVSHILADLPVSLPGRFCDVCLPVCSGVGLVLVDVLVSLAVFTFSCVFTVIESV